MKIIGLNGEAGSGKDTAAKFIREYDLRADSIALADPLKTLARDVFLFTDDQLWGPSSSRNAPYRHYGERRWYWPFENDARYGTRARFHLHAESWLDAVLPAGVDFDGALEELEEWLDDCLRQRRITPRYVLQTLGTEWGRTIDKDIWVKTALRRAAALKDGDAVLITDVRFINEARAIVAGGGQVWRIERPGAGLSGTAGAHVSEKEQASTEFMKFVKYVVRNDGTLDELRRAVVDLYRAV